jgi:hypothetical protein
MRIVELARHSDVLGALAGEEEHDLGRFRWRLSPDGVRFLRPGDERLDLDVDTWKPGLRPCRGSSRCLIPRERAALVALA